MGRFIYFGKYVKISTVLQKMVSGCALVRKDVVFIDHKKSNEGDPDGIFGYTGSNTSTYQTLDGMKKTLIASPLISVFRLEKD